MIPGIHESKVGGYEIGRECFAFASIDQSPRFNAIHCLAQSLRRHGTAICLSEFQY